jgi:hypothetical protein
MTIATYSELVSELGDWLNRADLTAKIPTFIRLFEARMNRRLRSPDMEQTFSRTTIIGINSYALNGRVRELRDVYADSDTIEVNYTVSGENIVIDPVPTSEFTFYYSGYTTLSGLSDSNTTNWLLDDHPDAYLYGSLAEAYAFLKDDQSAGNYKGLWEEAMSEIIREANEKRLPAGPLQMQPPVIE